MIGRCVDAIFSHNLAGQGDQYCMFPFPLILARRGDNTCTGDGLGGSSGVQKPAPMITLDMSGTFENVQVSCFNDHPKNFFLSNTAQILNSPQRAIAINTNGLTVSGVTVNNGALSYTVLLVARIYTEEDLAAGAAANSRSNGKPAGANTDVSVAVDRLLGYQFTRAGFRCVIFRRNNLAHHSLR